MAVDLNKITVIDKFLNEGKLPELEISLTPSTIVGLGITAFLVSASLYLFFKIIGK